MSAEQQAGIYAVAGKGIIIGFGKTTIVDSNTGEVLEFMPSYIQVEIVDNAIGLHEYVDIDTLVKAYHTPTTVGGES